MMLHILMPSFFIPFFFLIQENDGVLLLPHRMANTAGRRELTYAEIVKLMNSLIENSIIRIDSSYIYNTHQLLDTHAHTYLYNTHSSVKQHTFRIRTYKYLQ